MGPEEEALAKSSERNVQRPDEGVSKHGRLIIKHLPLIVAHQGVHADFDPWNPRVHDKRGMTILRATHSSREKNVPSSYSFEYRTPLNAYDVEALLKHIKRTSDEIPGSSEDQKGRVQILGPRRLEKLQDRTLVLEGTPYHVRMQVNGPSGRGKKDQIYIAVHHAASATGQWEDAPLVRLEAQDDPLDPKVEIKLRIFDEDTSQEQVAGLVRLFFKTRFDGKSTPRTGRTGSLPPERPGLPERR